MQSQRRKIEVFLFCLFSLAESHAFGLSPIRGTQTIGKPLAVQIEVQSAPELASDCIKVRPTDSLEDFFVSEVKVEVAGPVNARRILLSSLAPVKNPFISFVIDVRCGNLVMSREYQLLADYPPTHSNLPEGSDNAADRLPETVSPAMSTADRPSYATGPVAVKDTLSQTQVPPVRKKAVSKKPAPTATTQKNVQPTAPDNKEQSSSTSNAQSSTVPRPSSPVVAEPALPVAAKQNKQTTDRLQVGKGTSQMQMAADALIRMEAETMERNKVTAELVSGLSSALNSIVELKAQTATQEKQMQQLIALQIESEKRRAEEREAQVGPWGLFALFIGSTMLGAVLVTLFHRQATRRQDDYSLHPTSGVTMAGMGAPNDANW